MKNRYKVLDIPMNDKDRLERKLNYWAGEGWRLINIVANPAKHGQWFFFLEKELDGIHVRPVRYG